MSIVEKEVKWFPKESEVGDPVAWAKTGTDVDDIIQLSTAESISDGKRVKQDTFAFTVLNTDANKDTFGDRTLDFRPDDVITIGFSRDKSAFVQVLSAKITDVSYKIQPSGRLTTVTGVSRTQSLLRAIFALKLELNTAPMMIATILREVNETNSTAGEQNKITFVYFDTVSETKLDQDEQPTSDDLTIQRFKADGVTQFPKVTQFSSWFNKAHEQIQKLSGNGITRDGNYIFYVDAQNNFFWRSKPSLTDNLDLDGNPTTITEGEEILNATINKDSTRVINFYIIHSGHSPSGFGILTFYSRDDSVAEHGISGKFLDVTSLADKMLKEEQEANPTLFQTNFPFDPFPITYDYTYTFLPRTTGFIAGVAQAGTAYKIGGVLRPTSADITAGGIIVSNDKEFDAVIIEESKARGKSEADGLLDLTADGLIKVVIELNGTTKHNKGDFVTLIIPSVGYVDDNTKDLRIHEIEHKFNRGGWSTTLTLFEDEIRPPDNPPGFTEGGIGEPE